MITFSKIKQWGIEFGIYHSEIFSADFDVYLVSCILILDGDFSMLTLFAEDIHNNFIELLKDNLYESFRSNTVFQIYD